MEIKIHSTDHLIEINGVPVRVWKGLTAEGIDCFVYVCAIAVRSDRDCSSFERELLERKIQNAEC